MRAIGQGGLRPPRHPPKYLLAPRFALRSSVLLLAVLGCRAPKQESAGPAPPSAPSTSSAEQDAGPGAEEELAARIRLVVTGESRNLRACYETGLARDPTLAGHVILVLDVSEKGRATRVLEAKR